MEGRPLEVRARVNIQGGVSAEFKRWCSGYSNFQHVGRYNRFARYRQKQTHDLYFHEFLNKHYPALIPSGFLHAHPNADAAYAGLMKYDLSEKEFDSEAWSFAWGMVDSMYRPFLQHSRFISISDAILNVNMRSSPGFPYTLLYSTKKDFFSSLWAYNECERVYNSLFTSLPVRALWTNNPKDEIRPTHKVIVNDLRTFLSPDVPTVIAHNCAFYDQNNKLYSSHLQHWSFVGGSKFYCGWNRIMESLLLFPNRFVFDFSQWDATVAASLLWKVKDLRFNWLARDLQTEQNYAFMTNCYYDIVNSLCICTYGEVMQKERGNPSGSVNTIVDNTIIQTFLIFYAWYLLAPEVYKHWSLEAIRSVIYCVLQGDDNTCSVSDEIVSWFNPKSLAPVWSSIGFNVKIVNDGMPVSLDHLEFCSNYFKKLEIGFWVPVPNADKVICAMALKSKHPRSIKLSVCRANALRVEAFYLPHIYNVLTDYVAYLLKNYIDLLKQPPSEDDMWLTYEQVLATCLGVHEISTIYLGSPDQVYWEEFDLS